MDYRKPVPVFLLPATPRRVCPVCGARSYSREGIHPQCAQRQAEAPRLARLKAEKRAGGPVAKEAVAPAQRSWHRPCPRCAAELHVRVRQCACGHTFPSAKAR